MLQDFEWEVLHLDSGDARKFRMRVMDWYLNAVGRRIITMKYIIGSREQGG